MKVTISGVIDPEGLEIARELGEGSTARVFLNAVINNAGWGEVVAISVLPLVLVTRNGVRISIDGENMNISPMGLEDVLSIGAMTHELEAMRKNEEEFDTKHPGVIPSKSAKPGNDDFSNFMKSIGAG